MRIGMGQLAPTVLPMAVLTDYTSGQGIAPGDACYDSSHDNGAVHCASLANVLLAVVNDPLGHGPTVTTACSQAETDCMNQSLEQMVQVDYSQSSDTVTTPAVASTSATTSTGGGAPCPSAEQLQGICDPSDPCQYGVTCPTGVTGTSDDAGGDAADNTYLIVAGVLVAIIAFAWMAHR